MGVVGAAQGSVSEIGGVRTTVIAMTHIVGAPTGAAVHTHRFPCSVRAFGGARRTTVVVRRSRSVRQGDEGHGVSA